MSSPPHSPQQCLYSCLQVSLLSLLGAASVLLAACATPVGVSTFDGIYTVGSSGDPSNGIECGPGSPSTLTMIDGVASLSGSNDRTGVVEPDGKIIIVGKVFINTNWVSNRIAGSFKDGVFDGVSSYPGGCKFIWHSTKRV
jgi:hypothetical protein